VALASQLHCGWKMQWRWKCHQDLLPMPSEMLTALAYATPGPTRAIPWIAKEHLSRMQGAKLWGSAKQKTLRSHGCPQPLRWNSSWVAPMISKMLCGHSSMILMQGTWLTHTNLFVSHLQDTISTNNLNLSSQLQWEMQNRRIMVQVSLGQKQDPTSK
jgi:uncharacterized lipoprotein NlpE involved in copper resistance